MSAAGGSTGALERLLRRDRTLLLAALAALVILAWAYTVHLARMMPHADMAMAMPGMHPWQAIDVVLLSVMWAVMMVAMMVPSATPVILLVANVNRRRRERASPAAPTSAFVLGYLLVWTAFAIVAAIAQWALHGLALLSPAMVSTSSLLGSALLIAAGIYQWTPLKRACLGRCRSPMGFITAEWREGTLGALLMGLRHGSYCLGCCWVLMTLLFVGGVMNLLWVAVIAAFVLAEKLAPRSETISRVAGLLLVGWGGWLALAA